MSQRKAVAIRAPGIYWVQPLLLPAPAPLPPDIVQTDQASLCPSPSIYSRILRGQIEALSTSCVVAVIIKANFLSSDLEEIREPLLAAHGEQGSTDSTPTFQQVCLNQEFIG